MPVLDFFKAEELLKKYHIPFASFNVAHDKEDAVKKGKRIGFPLVMKIISPDILHKTEKKVVKTAVLSEEGIRQAWDEIMANAGKARFEGMLLQKQAFGKEIIIGGKTDPQFGQVVIFGWGGIFVEIIKEIVVRVAPIDRHQALEMMSEMRGYSILKGARGEKPVDLNKIADAIVAVSKMLADNPRIKELDLNPCFVNERDCIAVDVRMMVE
jgi:acetyl-CoA synthetase (ADP-forming)